MTFGCLPVPSGELLHQGSEAKLFEYELQDWVLRPSIQEALQ